MPVSLTDCDSDNPFPFAVSAGKPAPPVVPCAGCGGAVDCAGDSVFPYSLTQGPILPFVGDCPPGFDCSSATSISFNCCGNILVASRPANATRQQISDLFASIVAQCAQYQSICGLNFSMVPTIFYLNPTVSSPAICPDGTQNTFTQPAGSWSGLTQADAQNQASNAANQQALLRQVCLGPLQSGAASGGLFFSQTLLASGQGSQNASVNPWSIVAGALPAGLSFGPPVFPFSSITISGTPVALGNFNFTVQFTSPTGSIKQKNYAIVVSSVIPTLSLTPEYNAILALWPAVGGATSYQLFRRVHNVGSFVLLATTSGLFYNDLTPVSGTSYDYNLEALAGAVVLGTSSNQTASPLATPAIALIAGYGAVACSWAAVPNATSYQVLRCVHNTGSFVVVNTTSGLTFNDTTVIGGNLYDYKFTAFNGANPIVTSLISVVTPLTPAAPNLSAVAGNAQVALSWSASTGATSYKLFRGTANGGPYPTLLTTTAALNFTDTGLVNGTTYYYVVQAFVNATSSVISSQASATPQLPGIPLNFNSLIWTNPPVLAQNFGHGSLSWVFANNGINIFADCPANQDAQIVFRNTAHIPYTGPAVSGNVAIGFASFFGNSGSPALRFSISNNAGILASGFYNSASMFGTLNIPFTVPISVADTLVFSVEIDINGVTSYISGMQAHPIFTLTPAF